MKLPPHWQAAAHCAEQLVRRLELTALPIDPFEVAKRHEIVVEPKASRSEGVSGFFMKVGDIFGIMYATHIKNEGFVRFTIAHELGHYFLPGHPEKLFANGDGVHESKSGFLSRDRTEEEADHFAASLLMPTTLFTEALGCAGEGFAAIDQLASLCRTSITATAIRFATHSPDPVAVIVSSGRTIEYCFLSDVLRDIRGMNWIRKGELVPKQSETHAFNADKAKVTAGAKAEAWTSLDLWFDGAPGLEMKEDVVGLGTYDKTLTVLFTDDAIEEPEDDDSDE